MKVVLVQDVKGLGKKLAIVEVSEGYARNFLIPRKLAKIADNKSISETKSQSDAQKFKKEQEIKSANELKEIIEKITLTFKIKVGEKGKLFGSITEKDISDKLNNEKKIKIDKKKIQLKIPVKALGVYTAELKIYEGIIAKLNINVLEL